MEAVKQKKTFKESMKDTGNKAKAYAKKQTDKVKQYGKNYSHYCYTYYPCILWYGFLLQLWIEPFASDALQFFISHHYAEHAVYSLQQHSIVGHEAVFAMAHIDWSNLKVV